MTPAAPNNGIEIAHLEARAIESRIDDFARLLLDIVAGGASVGFMASLSHDAAVAFWQGGAAAVGRGERILLAAFDGTTLVGTVQVVLALPPNQLHRADIAKLQVLSSAWRRGIAVALMARAEAAAAQAGRSLLMLDTTTGSAAERLYLRLGWTRFGVMPNHALLPDGRMSDTSFFYKPIAPGLDRVAP